MSETPSPPDQAPRKSAPAATPDVSKASGTIGETERSFAPPEEQVDTGLRTAEDVVQRTAETGQEAVRASSEVLQRSIEAAEDVAVATAEVGAAGVESLTRAVAGAVGAAAPDGELAEQSGENVMRAVSEAGASLIRVGQEASRAWLGLCSQSTRTNLEALSDLARCGSVPELVAVQVKTLRSNMNLAIDAGLSVIDVSNQAIGQASRAIQDRSGPAQSR